MSRNLPAVAVLFYWASAVVALPSLIATCYFGYAAIRLRMMPKPALSGPSDTGNTAVDLLVEGGRAVGKVAGFIGGLGQAVITGIAIASALVLLYGVLLYLTGRGLSADRGWARILGILLMIGPLLASLGLAVGGRRPAPLLLTAATGYLIWRLR